MTEGRMAEQESECVDVPGPWLDAWPRLPKRGRIVRQIRFPPRPLRR